MKIVVTADSHGDVGNLLKICEENADMNALVFLGDGETDIEDIQNAYPTLRVYAVGGNCDRRGYYPDESLAVFGGKLVFYTHGSTYGVKRGLDEIKYRARQAGAEVLLFGHTHTAVCEKEDDLLVLNPGTVGSMSALRHSYGVLNINGDKVTGEIINF
ncbi:MAG: YfcE family phosphodiesterase [Oscillospiraceae bacterium]